jgi:hypothetical protein
MIGWSQLSTLLRILSLGIFPVLSAPVLASTIELRLHPAGESTSVDCPEKAIAYQTPKPYQEGGYQTDGMVRLQEIATQISVTQTDPFSVTWIGTLKPQYQNCQATAGMTSIDGQPYPEHSYLRMRLLNGKAYFILDMTGMQDANGLTPVILYNGMRQANPRWTWGGTD